MSDIRIVYDGNLDIATGKSRHERNWKNRQLLWSQLLTKVSSTHTTHETYAEYIASPKSRQDEVKDIGGFVGGYLTGGRRKPSAVTHRQLITLDLDSATADSWDSLTLLYGCAAAVYSTHKHAPESPRLRILIPLDREVFADEYVAIARRIAGDIGIEAFDNTGFQPSRLMYWPSTSKDGQYLFEYQDGPWLSADEVLARYHDWRDSSEWPVSEKVSKLIRHGMKKQGDPLEKPGVVGAFCRTYDIHEAIETFLVDTYETCDVKDRYTYKEGSTAAGLVIYDDKFAFSHHGTDPTSGMLCNAFDLVRVHKFGLKDEDAKDGTPGNKLPSYTEMISLAAKDAKVKGLIVSERIQLRQTAAEDFNDDYVDPDEDNDKWVEKLDVDRKGNVMSTTDNIVLIFENDPYFKSKLAYDDFEKCEVAVRDLPWRKVTTLTRRLIDKDDANIRHYLEKTYGISNMAKTRDAMDVISVKTSFHPVKQYLQKVQWDGEPRIDRLLIDYQGASDSEYTRTVIRKSLVAAVARVFEPGIKFDHVLVLVGKQGLKKSTLISKLGRQWFSDSFSTIEGKEAFEQLQGVWLVEIAELAGLARAEVEKIKHFISKRDDRYRVAFGRRTEKFPRQCVFFATTNKRDFLKDPTGDRRYWPVLVNETEPLKNVFTDLTDAEVNQIWAEAMMLYNEGETIYLPEHLVSVAAEVQKNHTEEHPWAGIIRHFLDIKLPTDWHKRTRFDRLAFLQNEDDMAAEGTAYRDRVCIHEIWVEALNRRDTIDDRSATIIRNIMMSMESWKERPQPSRYGVYGIQRKGYERAEIPEKILAETTLI